MLSVSLNKTFPSFHILQRATFQSVLISSAEKSYVMSFYEKDAMGWSSMHSKNVVIGYSWAVNKYFTELSSQRESDISLDAIAGNTPAGWIIVLLKSGL